MPRRCWLLISLLGLCGCFSAAPPPRPQKPAAPPSADRKEKALYYYDLGPEEIDVLGYPPKQQVHYAVFSQVCSQCHTLARAINSPRESYWAWDYYVMRMRLRGKFSAGKGFTKDQAGQILDFLAYDSKIRKGKNREAFEQLTRELEQQFDQMMEERIHKMQQGPRLLPKSSQ